MLTAGHHTSLMRGHPTKCFEEKNLQRLKYDEYDFYCYFLILKSFFSAARFGRKKMGDYNLNFEYAKS